MTLSGTPNPLIRNLDQFGGFTNASYSTLKVMSFLNLSIII